MSDAHLPGKRWTRWLVGAAPAPVVVAANAALLFLLAAGAATLCFQALLYTWNWPAIWKYRALLLEGWWTTVLLSLGALAASLLIGTALAFARRSPVILCRCFAIGYVEIVRGTPLLVQILLLFYVVANALRVENRYLVGALALALFSGAYISEIIRSGIESVGRSQLDAARAVGFDRRQVLRYVVLPQALRHILPPLAGQFASLIKDSSLLSIIAVKEFTLQAQQVNAYTYSTLESYLPLALGYLLLTLPLSLAIRRLEARSHYET